MTVAERAPHIHELLVKAADLHRADAISEAAAIYEDVLKEAPEDPDALHLAGLVASQRGYPMIALELVSRSLAIRPNFGAAHGTLGAALGGIGRGLSAQAEFHRAVMLDPSLVEAWANLTFAMNLDPGVSLEAARDVRRRFDALHIKPLVDAALPNTNDRNPDRRLTIGYVGNDFRTHSAGALCWPVISRHDTERFRVVLFDGSRAYDAVSARFEALPGLTRIPIRGKSDEDVADLIRAETVDVLIDLTGFAAGTRLKALARRPAPVQIEGWGYLSGTTALSCFDEIFADKHVVLPGEEAGFTERLLMLPSFIPYEPLVELPLVAPAPILKNGFLTWGYLGRPEKVNERVLAVWAEILHRTPTSRLLLKHNRLDSEDFAFAIVDQLVARGIPDGRIEIRGGSKTAEHAAVYAEVDIALDPFPETGGVTTLESAHQGVPTVTMFGNRMGARMGTSIVRALGHPEWVAHTPEAYVEIAVLLAAGAETFNRERLRDDLYASVYMQHEAYTRALEDKYREAWRRWCGQSTA